MHRPLRDLGQPSGWHAKTKSCRIISKSQISQHSVEQPEAHLQKTRESAQDSPRHNEGELVLPRLHSKQDLATTSNYRTDYFPWLSDLVISCQYSLHETYAANIHGENLYSYFWKDKKVYAGFYDQKNAKLRSLVEKTLKRQDSSGIISAVCIVAALSCGRFASLLEMLDHI